MGLGVNTRVLMIGAHPDDEDTYLITWLSRGRYVKTAYLSLTRGDGGQNLIGNELGEALGVIRTEELLAARRIDGADQYFTRAFDFGFSRDTVDTYNHWPRDSILGDVVRVVRAFRPHVIVAVFSGTPRDGHGHHQVSGLLAREAYEVSGDTVRFPVAAYGAPWTTSKFYRAARGNAQAGTLGVDVGEYSPLNGQSYAEIAAHSLSQHKSQGFAVLPRKGPVMNYVRREATRVNETTLAASEQSLFDGVDTTWARLRNSVADAPLRIALDTIPKLLAAVRANFDPFAPAKSVAPLLHARRWIEAVCPPVAVNACHRVVRTDRGPAQVVVNADLATSIDEARGRVQHALRLASGVSIDAMSFEVLPLNRVMPAIVEVFNRGRDTIALSGAWASGGSQTQVSATRLLPPGRTQVDTAIVLVDSVMQPWWLARGRTGGMFALPGTARAENTLGYYPFVSLGVDFGGRSIGDNLSFGERIVFRRVDDVRGEVRRPTVGAPAITVTLDDPVQYMRARSDVDREIVVRLRSADPQARTTRVSLELPRGLTADSVSRTVELAGYDAQAVVTFRVRGRIEPGDHRIAARAESSGETFAVGYQLIDYEHIRRQRIYRPATIRVSAVDVRVPGNLSVGYIAGVGDNVAPALAQLGIPVTVIPAADVARAPLSGYTTLVIGPRAYEAHPALVGASGRILEFARRGGTVVAQYGQYEMTQPGIMPFPITINRPHDRVTLEGSPVTILDANARELTFPNRITAADFADWVQERALYMPRTFDPRYRALLAMNDPGQEPNRGAILVAPLGEGRYIYTTAAFFRQLPAGVPGGARLFVNLLSAGLAQTRATP
jgi:LmbE family N-acetylglucosaminyl deacetylase